MRTSLGPRAARVHVGAGRSGMSTGAGPFGYYTSFGSRPRGPGPTATTRQVASASRSTGPQTKAERARELEAAFDAIHRLVTRSFPEARRPEAPLPPAVDIDGIRDAYALQAKRSTSIFARRERQVALAEARSRADAEIAALNVEYAEQRKRWQAELDSAWDALRRNEPDVVFGALTRAFEDNEGTAAPVGVRGDEVSLAVIVPPDDVVPDRRPTTTAAGNLSLKKLTKREIADVYKLLVAGLVLVTLKECFAVAPGVRTARAVAMRRNSSSGIPDVLIGATVGRTSLLNAPLDSADAVSLLQDCASELVMREKGSTKALQPLDVSQHPDLERLVEAVTFDDSHVRQVETGRHG